MDFKPIEGFVCVAEWGSFTRTVRSGLSGRVAIGLPPSLARVNGRLDMPCCTTHAECFPSACHRVVKRALNLPWPNVFRSPELVPYLTACG